MAYTIVVVCGPETGRRFTISSSPAIIGRDPEADIYLDIDGASREHCSIGLTKSGNLVIEDLQSRNGTKVNGQSISGSTTSNPVTK